MNHKAISVSSSGANEIVAAVPGRRIRVLSYIIVADAAVKVTWRSGSTDLSGQMNLAAAGYGVSSSGSVSSMGYLAQFVTAPGEALNLNLSLAAAVGGHLTYEIV